MYELKITNLKKTYLLPGRGLSVRKALPQKKQALAGGVKRLATLSPFS